MEYEVIVIGGGIGGLTTAAVLAARGVNVCLFERQSLVGGCVANFEHLGYAFEPTAGLYSGWGPGETWERLFSELPLPQPAVSKLSPNYIVRLPNGKDVPVSDEHDRFKNELAAAFPDCVNAAIDFFQNIDRLNERAPHDAITQLLNETSSDFRLFVDVQLQTLAQCSSAECSGTRAADVLTTARRGMWSINGGAQALADRLAECVKKSGGGVRLNSPVLRLAYGGDGDPVGIDLLSGERVLATRAIVSNLTVWDTYGKLIGLSRTPKSISADLRRSRAFGAYLIFLGMDEVAGQRLPANRMLVVTDARADAYTPETQQLTLNAASESDARAPHGKRAVSLSTFTQVEDWFTFHEDEASHEEQDQASLETWWARLHSAVPELGDAVEVIETATPRAMYEATRRKLGMIGRPQGLSQAVSHGAVLGTTVFPNVFMVGDTVSGGIGLEGLAISAFNLANHLTNRS